VRPALVRLANDLAPPALLRLVRRRRRRQHGFFGRYATYAEAESAAGGEGYADAAMLAALVARQLERAGDAPPLELNPGWLHLQLAVGHALDGREGAELRVLDFGGGAGVHYIDVTTRRSVSGWPSAPLRWRVCETPAMVAAAAGRLAGEELSFYASLDELDHDAYDLVYASGSLQYVPDAGATWDRLAALRHRWLAIHRTPFVDAEHDVFAVQRAPVPGGGTATYPGRFLAARPWRERIARTHDVVARWDVDGDRPYIESVRGVRYEGMLLRRR
jgi:putative methyltransferase (TIGR04325 family)